MANPVSKSFFLVVERIFVQAGINQVCTLNSRVFQEIGSVYGAILARTPLFFPLGQLSKWNARADWHPDCITGSLKSAGLTTEGRWISC
jgi:hypothetical protein